MVEEKQTESERITVSYNLNILVNYDNNQTGGY